MILSFLLLLLPDIVTNSCKDANGSRHSNDQAYVGLIGLANGLLSSSIWVLSDTAKLLLLITAINAEWVCTIDLLVFADGLACGSQLSIVTYISVLGG